MGDVGSDIGYLSLGVVRDQLGGMQGQDTPAQLRAGLWGG